MRAVLQGCMTLVIETIRSYVRFAGWEVQFIISTSSKFVEAWYKKVMQTSIY